MSISSAFASILRSGRADFNARFMAARHVHPELDADAFAEFLRTEVNALAQAVERARPDHLADVAMAAYDAALELVGQRLAGPGSRVTPIEEAWRRVLPQAAPLVADAPGRMIAAVCNAAHQLAATPGARPGQWIETMATLAPQCADADTFLKLGQVAAWRAGLAHFRRSALAVAAALPEALALTAAGANQDATWADVSRRLSADPWFDPASKEGRAPGFRVAGRVGSFRGFGGLFIEPPRLCPVGENFLVSSGDGYWLLTADAFGATFHRASKEEFNQALKTPPLPPGLRIESSRVTMNGASWELPSMGSVTSAAANQTTLAVATQLSHAILLVALSAR
jgi:hypothetical protein